jgi:DNA-binding response OmpR family regulator
MHGNLQARYRVAVIEADELVRELLLRWLREEGHEAADFADVSLLQGRFDFDVLIADLPSPRRAAEPVRLLRSVHRGAIVLVSARLRCVTGRSRELARELGVSAMLPKPFTRQELLAAVDEAMRPA